MRVKALLFVTLLFPSAATAVAEGPNDKKGTPRPIEMADILAWKSIRGAALSPDGSWLAYRLSPTEGDSEVIIRSTSDDTEYRFEIGEAAGGGRSRSAAGSRSASLAFSEDSRWLAFTIYPSRTEKKRLERASRSRSGSGSTSSGGRRSYNSVGLVEVSSGEQQKFAKTRSFAFSGENPDWLALHRYPAENQGRGDNAWTGSNLILKKLGSEVQHSFGNVSAYRFDKPGHYLAFTIDAEDRVGNGVVLRDLVTGRDQPLDSAEASYERLQWTEEGDGLAVLIGRDDDAFEDKLFTLAAWRTADLEKIVYDPHQDDSFPDGMTISNRRSPRWSEDLSAVLFGIHQVRPAEDGQGGGENEQTPEAGDDRDPAPQSDQPRGAGRNGKDDPDPAGLVIWHWKDSRLQSMQQVQESRDKNFSYLALYRPGQQRFVRLADDRVRNVTAAPKDRYAIGTDVTAYELAGNLDGRRFRDVYVIDMETGDKTLAIEKVRWYNGASPDGEKLLYYRDGHYHVYDLAASTHTSISAKAPTSFINSEDDHNIKDPPIRPLGWTRQGRSVVLYDNWDLWEAAADGSGVTALTDDGREQGIRYRRRFVLDADEEGIDLSGPVYVEGYQERTKQSGVFRLTASGGAERLLWDDASFSVLRAEDAPVFLYTRQTSSDYPDYYVAADASLAGGRRITEANPEQGQFRWSSGARLIDYTSDTGKKLQAALFLPADYEEGKSYPTIVYIYEKLSQRMNSYDTPSANGFNKSVYTSNGYAVLMPDIVYQINDPGRSAVWCVLPALKAAIDSGVVDSNRVGLHGHSWGGYQTSFLVTQTDAFKAAVAGAPLTNMISMYSSVYWNSGGVNGAIFESSQGRFTGGPWEVPEAYARNSPVYFAENVQTPLIILHNDKDGAVDFNQGIEYFNTLRRLQKPVIMLQYEGENHGLRIPANRKDYTVRMREFFDHYLKDQPMPRWLEEGIPHLEHEDHLEERAVGDGKKGGSR